MSGRALATVIGKSEAYVRERLKDTFEFTLGDVERFALYIGVNPEEFVGQIERRELVKDWPVDERPMTAEEVRIFADDLARKRSSRDRSVAAPEETALPRVAKKKSRDPGGDEGGA